MSKLVSVVAVFGIIGWMTFLLSPLEFLVLRFLHFELFLLVELSLTRVYSVLGLNVFWGVRTTMWWLMRVLFCCRIRWILMLVWWLVFFFFLINLVTGVGKARDCWWMLQNFLRNGEKREKREKLSIFTESK